MSNPYTTLGVESNATTKEIKKAYKRLAAKYHPDKNGDPSAVKIFQEIQKAYETLTGANKSRGYDDPDFNEAFGGYSFQQRRPEPEPQRIRTQINVTLEEAFNGSSYMLDGKSYSVPKGIRNKSLLRMGNYLATINVMPHAKYKRSGDDLLVVLEIDAIEAMLGVEVELITLDHNMLKFKIPAGVQPDQISKLSKKGIQNPEIPSVVGDLLVQVKINIPKDLTEEQKAVIISLPSRKLVTI